MRLQLERPLAFFDLETTGVRIGRDKIVQIGIVRLMTDGTREPYSSLVNPGMPIPPEASRIHGIGDDDVKDAPALADIADEVVSQLAGCDLAGFNCIRFDVPFLQEELMRSGLAWDTASFRIIDMQRIYHKKEPRDLSAALRFYCGREHDRAHDAIADVEATIDVLFGQLERYPDLPGHVGGLGDLIGDRDRPPDPAGKLRYDESGTICINFGKYSGWTLENVGRNDPGYLDWFFNKSDFPELTKAVARKALSMEKS